MTEKAPALSVLALAYGSEAPSAWLVPQLIDLDISLNRSARLDELQYSMVADAIYLRFYYLKVSELILFFARAKTGWYGKFYNGIETDSLCDMIARFVNDRNNIIEKVEQERKRKERESWSVGAITYEEYLKSKK